MARIPFLTLTLLWVTTATLQAGNRIIPYLIQAPEFSTWIQIINVCSEPSGYLIYFIGSDGERTEFAFSSGELWNGVHGDEISPGANYFFSLPESEDEIRQGYGEIIDDGDGCIAFEVHYRQSLPDGSFKWARTVPRNFSSSGVAVSFFFSDSCDTGIAIAGDGTRVSLEATDQGEILDRVELGNVYFAGVTMKDQFPSLGDENGVAGGILRILGNVGAVASITCDGELRRDRYVHPLPPTVQYEVLSFTAKHLERDWIDAYLYGHKYAYRLTLRNPTQKDLAYEAELLCRDEDGFVVARSEIVEPVRGIYSRTRRFHVNAGSTRAFEGTSGKGLHFETDPSEITVEVIVKVWIPAWWER